MKNTPGPRAPPDRRRPSRNMTDRSYSWNISTFNWNWNNYLFMKSWGMVELTAVNPIYKWTESSLLTPLLRPQLSNLFLFIFLSQPSLAKVLSERFSLSFSSFGPLTGIAACFFLFMEMSLSFLMIPRSITMTGSGQSVSLSCPLPSQYSLTQHLFRIN